MRRKTWTGKRLRALMAATGLAEVELADRLGVTQKSINNWLNDRCRMSLPYRRALEAMEHEAREKVGA